ncbi:MAG: hypothetical protein WBA77_13050 [Microcoleaceae cyanobacterium]
MKFWKSLSLGIILSLSNSYVVLSNPLKSDTLSMCSSENTKIEFETSSYLISIKCKTEKLYYQSRDKTSQKLVKIPAIYDDTAEVFIAQDSSTTYTINFFNLHIYQQGHEIVKEPVLNIYTNSNTPDIDFFNPNRKVAYYPFQLDPNENYLMNTSPISV